MRPTATIETCRRSHRLLLKRLDPLTDLELRGPSLLPGYTRAHVVAHLTNKAQAHAVLADPGSDRMRRLHPEGYDPDLAAELTVQQAGTDLRALLAQSLSDLEAAWETLDEPGWKREHMMMAGLRSMPEIVGHHLRNVEVHHVDLDIGHHPSDWPQILIETELPKRLGSLPHRTSHAGLLAWLLGRAPAPELTGPW